MTPAGFPHSDIFGSKLGKQLPEAFRSYPRPSSPPSAKAFTICPYLLNQISPRALATSPPGEPEGSISHARHAQNAISIGHRKTIRLSKTAESRNRPSSDLFRVGRPRGALSDAASIYSACTE